MTFITIAIILEVCHGVFFRPGSTLLLTGDFNVMSDGYENSKVMMMMTTTMIMMILMMLMILIVMVSDGYENSKVEK